MFFRGLASRMLELAVRVSPKRRHVVVYGYPAQEGNAVETVRALSARYRGTVYWLDGPAQVVPKLSAPSNVQVKKRMSLAAIGRYVTAEAVFYTHGLYGNPSPSHRQPIVNLWHGDGIKAHNQVVPSRRSVAPATYVVGGTKLLTDRKAVDFKMPPNATIVTGNPRIDQFKTPSSKESLAALGIDCDRPFVLWMPTFRKAVQTGVTPGWTDSDGAAYELAQHVRSTAAMFSERGVQLVVKPHPMDAESRQAEGCILVTDDLISAAGTTLYELLGGSAGLISDYSSVWTDYLVLDRPIAFLIPDKDAYTNGRGVYPADAITWLPGKEISSTEHIQEFLNELLLGSGSSSQLRNTACGRLGLVKPLSPASHELLDKLEDFGVFTRSGGLKPYEAGVVQ